MSLAVVVEGDTDLPVVRKLAEATGWNIELEIDAAGKGNIDSRLAGYNAASAGSPWLVVRDLDEDAGCAPQFLRDHAFQPGEWMCFRLAVREIESWLMADKQGLAEFLDIDPQWIPSDPDREADPTATLVSLARRSPSGPIKRGLVPAPGARVSVGPLYEALIIKFGQETWSLTRALAASPSLERARTALAALRTSWGRLEAGQVEPAAGVTGRWARKKATPAVKAASKSRKRSSGR